MGAGDAQPIALDGFYERMDIFAFGPRFRCLERVWTRGDDVFAEVELPEEVAAEAAGFALHPGLLDSALHAAVFLPGRAADGRARLPFVWNSVAVHASGATTLRARISPVDGDGIEVAVTDADGQPVASAGSVVFREVAAATPPLMRVEWTPVNATGDAEPFEVLDLTSEVDGRRRTGPACWSDGRWPPCGTGTGRRSWSWSRGAWPPTRPPRRCGAWSAPRSWRIRTASCSPTWTTWPCCPRPSRPVSRS
ncbi:polyketide synthase dehydratase domain-containing protein [Kutzneria sp. 744]|uniref:polyketide synthase dehydratase domain-containing protein n=1 Tax=Kutzneria sp. (strain 744) TaxID=345341 RepID=UPI003510211A